MTSKQAYKILNHLKLSDGVMICYGWHESCPGLARYGWARYSAGQCTYLGRSALEIVEAVDRHLSDGLPLDVAGEIRAILPHVRDDR